MKADVTPESHFISSAASFMTVSLSKFVLFVLTYCQMLNYLLQESD